MAFTYQVGPSDPHAVGFGHRDRQKCRPGLGETSCKANGTQWGGKGGGGEIGWGAVVKCSWSLAEREAKLNKPMSWVPSERESPQLCCPPHPPFQRFPGSSRHLRGQKTCIWPGLPSLNSSASHKKVRMCILWEHPHGKTVFLYHSDQFEIICEKKSSSQHNENS